MPEDRWMPTERRLLAMAARSIAEICVRNSYLEDLHAGTFPDSCAGDYSDVKVVSPYGEIPWNDVSRISDAEMKALMVEVVNRVFTYLSYPDELAGLRSSAQWDPPCLDEALMRTVRSRWGDGGALG